jgi:hypothetical protein
LMKLKRVACMINILINDLIKAYECLVKEVIVD